MNYQARLPYHVIVALSQIGQKEVSGKGDNPSIIGYWKHTHIGLPKLSDEIPWCAVFVNFCLEEAGKDGTGVATAESYTRWGNKIIKPMLGDVVLLTNRADRKINHVGFYIDRSPSIIYVLGGNQRDSVCMAGFNERAVVEYRTLTT